MCCLCVCLCLCVLFVCVFVCVCLFVCCVCLREHYNYWAERSEAPHGCYIWDFWMYYICMDVRPTDLIQRTCTCTLLSKIEEELLARLTRLLGYHWLSGKLISSLHIHASHTWLLAVIQHNLSCITSSCVCVYLANAYVSNVRSL